MVVVQNIPFTLIPTIDNHNLVEVFFDNHTVGYLMLVNNNQWYVYGDDVNRVVYDNYRDALLQLAKYLHYDTWWLDRYAGLEWETWSVYINDVIIGYVFTVINVSGVPVSTHYYSLDVPSTVPETAYHTTLRGAIVSLALAQEYVISTP